MSDKPQFDPSKPFQAGDKPPFDPSKPIDGGEQKEGLGRQIVRGGLESLPGVGAIIGGVAGGVPTIPEGGIGAVPAGMLGYGAGKQLERLGKHYLLGDKNDAPATAPLDQVKQVAGDLGEGAAAEMGGQASGKVLSNVGQAISNRLRRAGVQAAVRHLRPTPGIATALGPNKLEEVGEEALRSGAIRPFHKVGDTAKRLGDLTDEVGAVKGDLVDESGAMMSGSDVEKAVHDRVIGPLETTTAGKRVAGPIRERLNALKTDLGEAPVPASRIEAEKMAESQDIPWLGSSTKARVGADKGYTSALRQSVEDAVESQAGPETLDKFLAAKKSFGNLDAAKDMADRTAGLTDGGTGLMGHIADTGAMMEGISGIAHGNPVQAATPVARAITKGRVASTVAAGAYGASKAVASGAESLSNPVAKAIAARLAPRSMEQLRTDYLGQQTDPQAQADLKKAQE